MTDNAFDSKNAMNENADNLAQNDESAEQNMSNEMEAADDFFDEEAKNDQENEPLDKLKAELDETKDKYIRLVAEFDNFRRRNAKERNELMQTAGRDIVQSLLVVLDDTDRAAKQMEKEMDIDTLKSGISLVFNKLRNTLQQKGLKEMDSMHQPFDPDLHEAITEIPAPAPDLVGKVLDVIEPGYYLNDKLIRHAKVVVGK